MKSTGIVRQLDSMGRIVIPKELRCQLGLRANIDSVEIYMDGGNIALRKFRPTCAFCDRLTDGVELNGITVCPSCVEKLEKLLKDEEQPTE